MATNLNEILGYQNLSGIAQEVISGIPGDILPPSFMTATSKIEGNTGSYLRVSGNRKLAKSVHYGSPSQRREQLGITRVPYVAVHTFENQFHDMTTLTALENFTNPSHQAMGKQEIARQTREFASYFSNLRIAAVYSALATGYIYFDSSGNMLPSSSGADTSRTVDYGVPADNQNQLNGIIGASWATATTDIAGDITALKEQARKTSGYPIRHAFYGANILGYFLKNTDLKNLITASPMATSFAGHTIPDGFLGLNWHPANEAFFVDNDGSTQDFWDGDKIVFTPEPSPDWWEFVEGSYHVPTNVNVSSDANSVVSGSMAKVYGAFSYANPSLDPAGIIHRHGDTFLPLLKVPASIFIADVVA